MKNTGLMNTGHICTFAFTKMFKKDAFYFHLKKSGKKTT